MLQKTFFASKGTKNLVEYPKPGRDFSTKSRKRSGERRSGAGNRTHAARGKKRPAASAGRQTGRERLYAGHVRPRPPTGIGDRKEGTGKRARSGACGNPPGDRTSPGSGREPRTEEAPLKKKPHPRECFARKKIPHERNPARKEPRTRESPAQTRKNPARKDVSHREKAPPERMFRTKKNPGRKGPHGRSFCTIRTRKIPHGSGKYQR